MKSYSSNQPTKNSWWWRRRDNCVAEIATTIISACIFFPLCNYIYKQINVKNLNRTSSTELCLVHYSQCIITYSMWISWCDIVFQIAKCVIVFVFIFEIYVVTSDITVFSSFFLYKVSYACHRHPNKKCFFFYLFIRASLNF